MVYILDLERERQEDRETETQRHNTDRDKDTERYGDQLVVLGKLQPKALKQSIYTH